MNPRRNYYRDLLCKPTDTLDTIKSCYRKIAKATHSDSNGGSDEYRELFEAATIAWSILGDPQKRASYVVARREWLEQNDGMECAQCGEALRMMANAHTQRCPTCKSAIPVDDVPRVGSSFFRPIEDSGRRIGETVLDVSQQEAERLGREFVQQSAQLLSKLIVNGFALARRKIGRTGR